MRLMLFPLYHLLLFLCLTPQALAQEGQGQRWALLVAGGQGYFSYFSQATIYHAYQVIAIVLPKPINIV